MNELILPPEPRQSKSERRERPTIEIVVEPRERETPRRRGGALSALLGLAALVGAVIYVFPFLQAAQFLQSALPKQAPAPVAAKEPDAALGDAQRQIASLQSEISELRAKLDVVEKRQATEAPEPKAAEAAPSREAVKEPTPPEAPREIAPARPAPARAAPAVPKAADAEPPAPVQRVAPAAPKVLAGFRLRDAFRGNALVETRRGVIDVQPGDVLPGAGRVLAIQRRGGRWVVTTESGDIVGAPPTPRRRPAWREEYGYEAGSLAPPLLMPF